MAIYRQVHTTIWQDNWVSELEPLDKLLWLYLLTNSKTTQSGVYEFSERYACFETGMSRKEVSDALQRFIKAGRIRYNQANSEIMVTNWLKFNSARSPKVAAVIDKELGSVKTRDFAAEVIKTCQQYEYPIRAKLADLDTVSGDGDSVSIPYGYSTDTITQPEPSPEPTPSQNQNHNQQSEQADAVDPAPSINFYQENLGVMPPILMEQVMDWVKDMGNELVIEAITRAVAAEKGWSYAQGILRNWSKKNIRTLGQVKSEDVAHDRQISARGGFGKPVRTEKLPDWAQEGYKPPKISKDEHEKNLKILAEQRKQMDELVAKKEESK